MNRIEAEITEEKSKFWITINICGVLTDAFCEYYDCPQEVSKKNCQFYSDNLKNCIYSSEEEVIEKSIIFSCDFIEELKTKILPIFTDYNNENSGSWLYSKEAPSIQRKAIETIGSFLKSRGILMNEKIELLEETRKNIYQFYHKFLNFGFCIHKISWGKNTFAKVVYIEGVTPGQPMPGKPPYYYNPPVYAILYMDRKKPEPIALSVPGGYSYELIECPTFKPKPIKNGFTFMDVEYISENLTPPNNMD